MQEVEREREIGSVHRERERVGERERERELKISPLYLRFYNRQKHYSVVCQHVSGKYCFEKFPFDRP
jgi:hypothetical protein